MIDDVAGVAAQAIKAWREDPRRMVRDLFPGTTPDPWQDDILEAFPHRDRLAMKACKGPGKTAVEAWCIWNFLLTRPFPKVAATSISGPNLRDNLWSELAKWRSKSPILETIFEWTTERIFHRKHPERWWASARKWSRKADPSQQADTLAGLHEDYMLFVIDEAGGVPRAVMASAEAGLSVGIELKLMIGGNPTMLDGPLWDACGSERHKWFVVEITGDPDDPKRATRIRKQWAIDMIEKYGRDDPWVLVNVFGKFPPSSMNTLLGPDDVSEAMSRHLEEADYEFSEKRVGVDVARFGDDSTIIFPRQGLAAFRFTEMRHQETENIAGRVAKAVKDWDAELVTIDTTGGYGAGVQDGLRLAKLRVLGVQFAGKPIDLRYLNKRAEIWFAMAQWVKRGGALPKDTRLTRELTEPTYWFKGGKFQLEDKEQIKERLGFSPDRADALATTFALPDMPGKMAPRGLLQGQGLLSDYDPYAEDRV